MLQIDNLWFLVPLAWCLKINLWNPNNTATTIHSIYTEHRLHRVIYQDGLDIRFLPIHPRFRHLESFQNDKLRPVVLRFSVGSMFVMTCHFIPRINYLFFFLYCDIFSFYCIVWQCFLFWLDCISLFCIS